MEKFLYISECSRSDVEVPVIDFVKDKVHLIDKNLSKTKRKLLYFF
jgi:hypothetical protein